MLEECGKSILFSFALLVSYLHSVLHAGGSETSHQRHGNQEMTELMETQVHIVAACACLSSCTVHLALSRQLNFTAYKYKQKPLF